jgi:hypothetical protein
MPEPARQVEQPWSLDAASLHPDLHGDFRDYYRRCATARAQLKGLLAEHLAIEHDLFLLSNTTHGLITALAGLALDGIDLDVSTSKYPAYSAIPRWPAKTAVASTPLLTHVDPLTGLISAIPKGAPIPTVVDAAQSFATIRYHADVLRADVFVCPLHKHAGIAAGLGLLGIKPELTMPGLRSVASVAETGTSCLSLLETAVSQIIARDGRILNTLTLDLDPGFREELTTVGVTVLTPANAGLPFVCLRGVPPPWTAQDCRRSGLFLKSFRSQSITRISGASRGSLNSLPQDRSADLKTVLLTLLR